MSATLEEKDRHIFPRWRSFSSTARLGELGASEQKANNDLTAINQLLEKEVLELSPSSLWSALDALSTAIVADRVEEFPSLRQRALKDEHTPRFAIDYLTRSQNKLSVSEAGEATSHDRQNLRQEIRTIRKRLTLDPRDAIEWVELARAYTIAGENRKAERAVAIAMRLAPHNRFVLRSAARFLIHVGEIDRAREVLAKSERLKFDPWLLAAEIAISDAMGKTSRNIKTARQHLSSDTAPSDLTELASAVGTLESQGGNARIARKLMRQAFVGANENSIAQINWVQRKHLGEEIDTSAANPPLLHEANAWQNYYKADFEVAKEESLLWLQDQPFASAPALLSSYLLSDVLGEFETAEEVLEAAVRANPDEAMLLNNLAFSQLNQGKIDPAASALASIKPEDLSQNRLIEATFGMLEFRRGNPVFGRQLYHKCIRAAIETGDRHNAARAAAHLLLEEIVADTEEVGNAFELMRSFETESSIPEINCVLGRAEAILERLHR